MPHESRFRVANIAKLVGVAALLLCLGVLLMLGWRHTILAMFELRELPLYRGAMSVTYDTRADYASSYEDSIPASGFADLTFDTTDDTDKVVAFYVWELSKRGWSCNLYEVDHVSYEPRAVCTRSGEGSSLLKQARSEAPEVTPVGDEAEALHSWRRIRIFEREPGNKVGSNRLEVYYAHFWIP